MQRVTDFGKVVAQVTAVWCAVSSVSISIAEETTAALLTVETVRSDYEASSETRIPEMALNAVVAAEDSNFFSEPEQNSTITVQLGNRYITPATRSVLLRITQFHNAMILARELTHHEILKWYSQEIWLGHGCSGLPDAAEAYFGKDVGALAIQEYALLAALIKSPAKCDPVRAYERATEARNHVIDEMVQLGQLSPTEASKAAASDLGVRSPVQPCTED